MRSVDGQILRLLLLNYSVREKQAARKKCHEMFMWGLDVLNNVESKSIALVFGANF